MRAKPKPRMPVPAPALLELKLEGRELRLWGASGLKVHKL